jgi:hypothetical protein
MHLGIVHDDGPVAMANGQQKRVGEIFAFDHDGSDPPNKFIIFNFDNGELGGEFKYLRGQMVDLEVDGNQPTIENGKVTAAGLASPDDSEYKETEEEYKKWRNEQAQALGRITGRRSVNLKRK